MSNKIKGFFKKNQEISKPLFSLPQDMVADKKSDYNRAKFRSLPRVRACHFCPQRPFRPTEERGGSYILL